MDRAFCLHREPHAELFCLHRHICFFHKKPTTLTADPDEDPKTNRNSSKQRGYGNNCGCLSSYTVVDLPDGTSEVCLQDIAHRNKAGVHPHKDFQPPISDQLR